MKNLPIITGCITVDVSKHVDYHGYLNVGEATRDAWRKLALGCDGLSVRINIGKAKAGLVHFTSQLIQECNILDAYSIDIEGTEQEGVKQALTVLHSIATKRAARTAA